MEISANRLISILIISLFPFLNASADSTIFINMGEAKYNDIGNASASSYSISQDFNTKYIDYDLGYLNEGTLDFARRSGVFIRPKLNAKFDENISTFMGLGIYYNNTTIYFPNSEYRLSFYSTAIISTVGVNFRLTNSLKLRTQWEHVKLPSISADTDIVSIGIGYTNE